MIDEGPPIDDAQCVKSVCSVFAQQSPERSIFESSRNVETQKDFSPAAWAVEAQMRAGEPTQLMDFLLEKQETL